MHSAHHGEDMPAEQDEETGLWHSAGFGVQLGDLRPMVNVPTTVTIFPLIPQHDALAHLRCLAPLGYRWKFLPKEFLYESVNSGVDPATAVPGAELDLPIALIPPEPIIQPFNELRLDYMKMAFKKGKKYGY